MVGELQSTYAQEWDSWKTPSVQQVMPPPKAGDTAPTHPNLALPSDKPTLIVFLRHCGCPFAEKVIKNLTAISSTHAEKVHCIAVSHSSPETTERWIVQVGGNWEVQVVVDHERELYALWGLGISNTWHVLNPISLYRTFQLGKQEGIWNRPTESGSRWQVSGSFAVDPTGTIKWTHVAKSADDVDDLNAALKALGIDLKKNGSGQQHTGATL